MVKKSSVESIELNTRWRCRSRICGFCRGYRFAHYRWRHLFNRFSVVVSDKVDTAVEHGGECLQGVDVVGVDLDQVSHQEE